MGVLDPLKVKASESVEEVDELSDQAEELFDTVMENRGFILSSDYESEGLEDMFGIDLSEMDSEQELMEGMSAVKALLNEADKEVKANSVALKYAEKKDIEPDYDNPVQSWNELGGLASNLEDIPRRIDEKVNRHQEGLNKKDVEFARKFFSTMDEVDALPIIEGVNASIENIEEEREKLMEHALAEHDSRSKEYDRPEIPVDPIDWEEVIQDNELSTPDYMDIDGINGASYGDVLHLMMEEALESREDINVEQPLSFLFPERPADRDPRPDVVDDLLVYDFKHMPWEQKMELGENGDIDHGHDKSIENVRQMNSYLHDLDLPAGVLVYVSSDMQVEEYVVEKHPIAGPDEYRQRFREYGFDDKYISSKEKYDFDQILDDL